MAYPTDVKAVIIPLDLWIEVSLDGLQGLCFAQRFGEVVAPIVDDFFDLGDPGFVDVDRHDWLRWSFMEESRFMDFVLHSLWQAFLDIYAGLHISTALLRTPRPSVDAVIHRRPIVSWQFDPHVFASGFDVV